MKKISIAPGIMAVAFAIATSTASADLLDGRSSGDKPALPQPPDSAAKARLNDASFVEQAAAGSMAEIEYSKLAMKKTKNAKLRSFAEQMVKDHETAGIKLKQIAETRRVPVPKTLAPEQQKTLAELQGLTGAQFDRTYINVMKRDHDTTVGLFDNAADETGLSDDFRNFATQTLPILRMHQQHAHALSDTDDSNMSGPSKP